MLPQAIHDWAVTALNELGMTATRAPELVRAMPWSQVWRLPTARGDVFLKHMGSLFAHEPRILHFLSETLHAPVPAIIADNQTLQCFLMRDAGLPLRPLLLADYQPKLIVQALQTCARIQQQALPHIETLLQLGAMDWRLQRLPDLFMGLLDNQQLMTAEGITAAERAAFLNCAPQLRAACDELAACGIPETLEHGDFHDNNIMLKNGAVIINDWGDASISHPFFSLCSLLESAGRNHKLQPDDARTALFTKTYLECWADFAPPAQLEKALALAQIIRPVQFSINYSRLAQNVALQPADYHAGWIAACLRKFAETALPASADY